MRASTTFRFSLRIIAVGTLAPAVHAQGIATDQLIESISVTARRQPSRGDVPSATASRTAAQLRMQNLVNPEDALKYAPNLTIRKRYIGDRNALIGGRSFSPLQAARGLVLMDGYLLSNFLGRFDAPRWNMIAAEEIERVDVLYGPFSAIYPGNSIGTTVAVTTRRPDDFELGVRTTAFAENFDEYGQRDDYAGYQVSSYLGNRFANGAWLTLALNQQNSVSHPMQYYAVSANAAGQFAPVRGTVAATPVTGVVFDADAQGRRRAVFGASGGAIDHTVQNQLKLRGGVALGPWLELDGFAALWNNDSNGSNRTLMRDANGVPTWSGRVIADGITFDVPATALAATRREETHVQWGATLRTRRLTGWNGSFVYSEYAIRNDSLHEAHNPDPTAANGGAGTVTKRDGTGWQTLELQALHTPYESDWMRGVHTLTLGFHQSTYQLRNPVLQASDWRAAGEQLVRDVRGDTRLKALYVQDSWAPAERWSLTLGARFEWWSAFDGSQRAGSAKVDYQDRSLSATSPKASLAFYPDHDWSLRLSAGRGVRFPTVAELFLGTSSANSITINDPSLRTEVGDSVDLTIQRALESGELRISLFEDDVRDSIFSQTNITVTPNITNVQNIDRVRSRGAELAFNYAVPGFESLSFTGNLAYVRSLILENRNNTTYAGNDWPRVPRWRGALQAVWRPTSDWLASLAVRHSGRTYGRLENDDMNSKVYGGVSRFTIYDARIAYTLPSDVELAIGVDNLTDERAYQYHPYPARTAFLEARWSFGAAR